MTDSYVRIKEKNAQLLNIELKRYEIETHASTDDVVHLVQEASVCDGVIVQLPLPTSVDTSVVLAAIPSEKDVDSLSGNAEVLPPVVAAIDAIIKNNHWVMSGKKVVVLGRGKLVGKPAVNYFEQAQAQVVSLQKGDDIAPDIKDADVLVLGAGSPGLVTKDMVKEGVIVFDAGTSESNGEVVGDAHPAVAEKASFFTPVPGGIGPVAVVEIFGNLLILAKKLS